VAIIGAGPAGLTCGYHLAKAVSLRLFRSPVRTGGMFRVGIPEYGCQTSTLMHEITGSWPTAWSCAATCVSEATSPSKKSSAIFDAVFIGVGAHKA